MLSTFRPKNFKGLKKRDIFTLKVVSKKKDGGGRGAPAHFTLFLNQQKAFAFQAKSLNKVRQHVFKNGYELVDKPVYLSVDGWIIRIQIKPERDGKNRDGSMRMMINQNGKIPLIFPTYHTKTKVLIWCTLYTKRKTWRHAVSVRGNKHAEKHFTCFIAFPEEKDREREAVEKVVCEINKIAPVIQPHKRQRVDK